MPPWLARQLAGASWEHIGIGYSGTSVFRIVLPDGRERYLKHAPPALHCVLSEERHKLGWLQGVLPVPDILGWEVDGEDAYLLLTALPGRMACDAHYRRDIPLVAGTVGRALRCIHAVPLARCPFDERVDAKLERAERRVRDGHLDREEFADCPTHADILALFERLRHSRPAAEDLVFTHGDYCLPNILLDDAGTKVLGFVDWARAGIADRYQDLALLARSFAYNFGPGWEPYLWEGYGLDVPDLDKIAYYQLLDRFA